MERSADQKKKLPLLVVGSLPFPGFEGEQLAGLQHLRDEELHANFLCLSGPETELRAQLDEAHARGLAFDQVLLYVRSFPETFLPPSACAVIEAHPEESTEDFRARLLGKIEQLRLHRLTAELEKLESSGVLRAIPDPEKICSFERARIAHALAYLYELSPGRHSQAIRLAFCHGQTAAMERFFPGGILLPAEKEPWPAALPPETLLALCASMALTNCGNAAQFRELFREKSSLLPFKIRNELKTQLEKILESVWGGKHAA